MGKMVLAEWFRSPFEAPFQDCFQQYQFQAIGKSLGEQNDEVDQSVALVDMCLGKNRSAS